VAVNHFRRMQNYFRLSFGMHNQLTTYRRRNDPASIDAGREIALTSLKRVYYSLDFPAQWCQQKNK